MDFRIKNLAVLFFVIWILSGCAHESMYYWGDYDSLVYSQYQSTSAVSPEFQITALEKNIQMAKSQNKPLPPGFYAHLGYEYLQVEKVAEARSCFEKEKANFPESAVLMDRFIKKLR